MESHNKALTILVVVVAAVTAGNALKCGDCLPNGIACATEDSFWMCTDEVPDKTLTMPCPDGNVCTGLTVICAPPTDSTPVCGDVTGCSDCSTGSPFTCISKSRYAFCSGQEVTTMVGKCPPGYVCDSSSAEPNICVKECRAEISCDVADP